MINKLKLAAASILLTVGLSGTAQADIVDFGDYLQDNSANLQWRDMTGTFSRSFDDISSHFSQGGDFEGWRYATTEEFQALIWNWTGIEFTSFYLTFGTDLLGGLIAALDPTSSYPITGKGTLFGRLDGDQFVQHGFIDHPYISVGWDAEDYIFMSGIGQEDPSPGQGGSFLVRSVSPVPAPAALPLALLGLAMVGAVYRRRQVAAKTSV